MSQQNDIKKLISDNQRRLQKLKERQAILGINTPPEVLIEIEDIETRIMELQTELKKLQTMVDDYRQTQPPANTNPPPRIFLSHASEDKPQITKLYHQLKKDGYHPWLDKYDLIPGQDWRREIEKIIRDLYNIIVVCLSNNSITKRGVIQQEIKWALDILDQMPEDTIFLIPARLEPCQVPDRLSGLHWVDLFEPDGYGNLKRALEYEIGRRG